MELMAYRAYRSPDLEIRYWRTSTGQEVDFVLNDREVAIEAKSSARVPDVAIRSLTSLAEDGPVRRRIVVCLERLPREISDRHGRVRLLPLHAFLEELWAGKVASAG
jgi:predicted AAA+ superfamily ATPase